MLIARIACALALGVAAKSLEMPDFLQTDPRAGLARSGSQFCAPTAVSNSLMWIAGHGAPNLRPPGKDAVAAQADLIRILGGPGYMGTRPDVGTDAAELVRGVERYVRDRGYALHLLVYQGWRPVPEGRRDGFRPDPAALARVITRERGAVWLNVGWYSYDRARGAYRRNRGHWVTLAGVDGETLLVNDPSPRAGAGPSTERVTLRPLAGRLEGDKAGLPLDARGYFALEGLRSMPRGADTVILDGAVLFALP